MAEKYVGVVVRQNLRGVSHRQIPEQHQHAAEANDRQVDSRSQGEDETGDIVQGFNLHLLKDCRFRKNVAFTKSSPI